MFLLVFARHDGATCACYLVKISGVEGSRQCDPRRLFGENVSSETHTSSGTSLFLTTTPSSFTAYLEKLYKETSLDPFESCVPISRRGRVLDGFSNAE